MSIVSVGSVALSYHLPEVACTLDRDYVMTYDEYKRFIKERQVSVICHYPISDGKKMFVRMQDKTIYEIEIAWPGSTAETFMTLVKFDPDAINGTALVPSLNALYAMKMSHRYLKNSPHFLKTMKHIQLMRKSGAVISDYYKDWFDQREAETYNYLHPNLDVKKDSFFKDESFYVYDHDTIHESVKIGTRPAYTYILADQSEVKCSLEKFNTLSYEQKLNCVLEESYVLALERSLIPNQFRPDPAAAFTVALSKVCTSITSGWFREWSWENYDNVLAAYTRDYVHKFSVALGRGDIKPFKAGA